MAKTNTIITIGREYGSAGRQIGYKVAEDLGIKLYDREMLERAAKESGICEELFETHDEKPTNSFLYSLVMDSYSFGYPSSSYTDMPINHKIFLAQFDTIRKIASEGPCILVGRCAELFASQDEKPTNSFLYSLVMDTYSLGYTNSYVDMPINHKVFLAQFDAIKKLAERESCVIVGRCADYALEEFDNVLSVFIHADMDARIRRIARIYDLTDAKAKDLIKKTDKRRSSYYNYYSNKKWGAAESYNICLDSSLLGIDGTAKAIEQLVELKENITDKKL